MELKRETVKFRDGTKLIVTEANWAASIKLQDLEEQAKATPLEDPISQRFNLLVYPKLAACSSGKVPSMQEGLAMPSVELDKWFLAVKRLNPDWFMLVPDKLIEESPEALAKKGKKPTESTPDS
jgi:hypothetical protein